MQMMHIASCHPVPILVKRVTRNYSRRENRCMRRDKIGGVNGTRLESMLFVLERKGLVHEDMHEMIEIKLDIYVCVYER